MSKEIEETRERNRQQKLLDSYANEIAQQLSDRGLYYMIAVIDPKNGTSTMGCEGRTNHIEAMTNTIVSSGLRSLLKDAMKARKRLRDLDPDYEQFNDPDKP